jgi:type VI secretion system secreted protein Hcp
MAATDFFLDIDGIPGDSQDKTYKGKIDIQSWSWGESNAGSGDQGGGHGAGRVSMQDFHFTMMVSNASPKLILACAQGDHIKKATVICRKAGGKEAVEYVKIIFEDVYVSSYQTGGSGSGVTPIDQISLGYEKVKYEYTTQKPDGTKDKTVTVGWDLKARKAIG